MRRHVLELIGDHIDIGGEAVERGVIGIVVSVLLNFLLRIYTSFKPIVTIRIMVLAAGVSIAVGIIFTLAPALKAARKNPIDALRNEQ